MILIDMTYANWTSVQIAQGKILDKGYIFKNEPVSFKALIELMRGYEKASNNLADANCWLSLFKTDFKTGIETVHNLHFSTRNKNRYRKYWQMALRVAGFK